MTTKRLIQRLDDMILRRENAPETHSAIDTALIAEAQAQLTQYSEAIEKWVDQLEDFRIGEHG